MDAKTLFYTALKDASIPMGRLTADGYMRPTPDTEWDARTLANHMLYELSWVPDIVAGNTIEEVGSKYDGDLISTDPSGNWQKAAARARQAVEQCPLDGTSHLSFGDVDNAEYLRQVGGDLLIHGWDLASTLGMEYRMDPEVARAVYDSMATTRKSWQDSGLFGTEISVPDDADIQTKLLALTGRGASWRPQLT